MGIPLFDSIWDIYKVSHGVNHTHNGHTMETNARVILANSEDFEKAFKLIDEAERIRRRNWANDKVWLSQNQLSPSDGDYSYEQMEEMACDNHSYNFNPVRWRWSKTGQNLASSQLTRPGGGTELARYCTYCGLEIEGNYLGDPRFEGKASHAFLNPRLYCSEKTIGESNDKAKDKTSNRLTT